MGTFTLLKKKVAGHFHFGQSDTFPGKPASGKNATVPLWLSGYLCRYWSCSTEQHPLESDLVVSVLCLGASVPGLLRYASIFSHGLSDLPTTQKYVYKYIKII